MIKISRKSQKKSEDKFDIVVLEAIDESLGSFRAFDKQEVYFHLQNTYNINKRDIPRKLSRNDRLIGSMLLASRHGIASSHIALGVSAAMLFRAKDEKGKLFGKDLFFVREIYQRGIDFILKDTCGLDSEKEKYLIEKIKEAYNFIIKDPGNWFSWPKTQIVEI